MLLLKATEVNWGWGDWVKIKWKIEDTGWYKITTSYRSRGEGIENIPDVTCEGVLSQSDLEELKAVLEKDWSNQETLACDGTAWEFKYYLDGQIIKHRELGYIYDIEPYEQIVKLLPRD